MVATNDGLMLGSLVELVRHHDVPLAIYRGHCLGAQVLERGNDSNQNVSKWMFLGWHGGDPHFAKTVDTPPEGDQWWCGQNHGLGLTKTVATLEELFKKPLVELEN